jgi:broad specificity phosphatase PhoE
MVFSTLSKCARVLSALLLLTGTTACARPAVTTVILVRHAERPPGADPELNEAGLARAESLAVALTRARIDAVFHTQFKRTQQTAAPLARQHNLTARVIPATGTEAEHASAVVTQVDGMKGKTVVYVGHSNTVPAVIQALGISPAPAIADTSYSHFFVVRRSKGSAELMRVRYGK